jgi:hypothetical protein
MSCTVGSAAPSASTGELSETAKVKAAAAMDAVTNLRISGPRMVKMTDV